MAIEIDLIYNLLGEHADISFYFYLCKHYKKSDLYDKNIQFDVLLKYKLYNLKVLNAIHSLEEEFEELIIVMNNSEIKKNKTMIDNFYSIENDINNISKEYKKLTIFDNEEYIMNIIRKIINLDCECRKLFIKIRRMNNF